MPPSPAIQQRPFGVNRRLLAASVAVAKERNTIHLITEVDVSVPRRLIAGHRERTGERLSFTAYVVACLSRACAADPRFNAFRKGRRLVQLEGVTISVLVERELDGEALPEPFGIPNADRLGYREIHDALHKAQAQPGAHLGDSGGLAWLRFVPGFLLRSVIRLAARNIAVQQRYGVVAVTAVGMFGSGPIWPIPISSATVSVAVGTIVPRVVMVNGQPNEREHLCLTLSFDHEVIDGAPAVRFAEHLAELLRDGDLIREALDTASAE